MAQLVKTLPVAAGGAGDTRDEDSMPRSGRFPGGGQGNPLQGSCWKIPRTEEPGRLQSTGLKESDTTEQLDMHTYEAMSSE